MPSPTVPASLQLALADGCKRICKAKSTVLFRRGEKAHGMFVVFSGNISLDFGGDTPLARSCGPGALVGLTSSITGTNYNMTATVTEDAELGFLAPEVLDSLMRENPDLCRELLTMLSERLFEIQQLQKALLNTQKQPSPQSPRSPIPEEHHVW